MNLAPLETMLGVSSTSNAPAIKSINGLPALELPGDDRAIGEFAADVGRHVRSEAIFVREGQVVSLDPAGDKLILARPAWLRTWIEKCVVSYVRRIRHGGTFRVVRTMTEDVARAVLESPQFLNQLREIRGLNPCRLPVMRENGTIELLKPGYDQQTKIFTHLDAPELELVDAATAKANLAKMFAEFPFPADGGRSKAVAISAMLTVFGSSLLLKGALRPCFVYIGNAEGCGKTMCAKLAQIPYTKADLRGAPDSEEEFEKMLVSAIIAGRKVLLLDNVKNRLSSAKLEGFLTAGRYCGRILGASKELSGEADITVLVTGNGLSISPDLRRRSLLVELFMEELRAEDRKFQQTLDDPALDHMRSQILSSLWSLVREWDSAGRPKASRNNSSFSRWCDLIGGIVEHAGFGCPTAPVENEGIGDTDTRDIAKLGGLMTPSQKYRFTEIVTIALENGLFERYTSNIGTEGSLDKGSKTGFSRLLVTYNDRYITAQVRFVVEGAGRSRRYVLEQTRLS